MDLSKDFGASRPLLLDKESYGHWKVKMRAVIIGIGMDAWSAVTDGWSVPTVKDDKGEDILKPIAQWTDAEKNKASANSKALTLIFSSINEHQFKRIQNCESAKDAWDKLAKAYEGTSSVKRSRLDMLASKFESLTMGESESVEEFSGKLSSIASEAHILGKKYKDKKLVKKLLRCLPARFESKRTALATSQNTDEIEFEEVVGMLQAHEMEILGTKPQSYKGAAAFTVTESTVPKDARLDSLEATMGLIAKRFTTVLKKIDKGVYSKENEKSGRKADIKCHECKGFGHIKADCPTWKKKENIKCYECKGYGHTKNECVSNFRKEKSYIAEDNSSSSESDSDDDVTGFVAFIGNITEGDADNSDSDETKVEDSDDEEDVSLEEQFRKLFESWTSLRKDNARLTDENLDYIIQVDKLNKEIECEKEKNSGLESAFAEVDSQLEKLKKELESERDKSCKLEKIIADNEKHANKLTNASKELDNLLSQGRSGKSKRGLGYTEAYYQQGSTSRVEKSPDQGKGIVQEPRNGYQSQKTRERTITSNYYSQ